MKTDFRAGSVSVCMAVFNGEQHIERQLRSIIVQLNDKDEVIISDDGSTDNTEYIIRSFNDPRIKLFNNKGRRGPVGNFENALTHSRGQFIFLSDQDDIWLPNKIEIVRSLLSCYDLVLSNCEVVDTNGSVIHPSFFNLRNSSKGFWKNIYKNSYMGCCMAFKHDILEYVLPIPRHVHMHDWWIGLITEIKGSVFFLEQPLIKYVRHGQNLSPTGESGYSFTVKIANRLILLFSILKRSLM